MTHRRSNTPRMAAALVGTVTAFGLIAAPVASANNAPPAGEGQTRVGKSDDRPNPLAEKKADLRDAAVSALVTGKASTKKVNGKRVIEVKGKDKKGKTKPRYVQYDVNQKANILSFLVEFGDQTKPAAGGAPGPLHNKIAQPDRKMDGGATDNNSTIWKADFNRQHYFDMMFGSSESFKDFYSKQSNGRFDVEGDVSDWVKVPFNEARYGHNPVSGDGTSEAEGSWSFIADSATAWVNAQKAAGKSDAQIKAYLQSFDKWDRYDFDGDGNFDEPDGYIDHFQAIHAGEGEEAGGGAQGDDAIWSHRWYAYQNLAGKAGPSQNKLGGVPLGDTGLWIGDYTTEPENGGLGVFTHEFGHDLGLPDLYDTTNKAQNDVSYWSLMSAGSWLGDGKTDIGSRPGYMGPWEKLQLGWLDATKVSYGNSKKVQIGPSDRDSATLGQAALINLPDKTITTTYNKPQSGANEWWGGSADNLNSTLTRSIDLTGKKSASVTTAAWYDTEEGYDFFYGEVSTDGGATWAQVGKEVSGEKKNWSDLTYDLSAYAGKKVDFRFRYASDGGVHGAGPFLDDIRIVADGATLLSDDVEKGTNGWVAKGFTLSSGTTSEKKTHYYLAENRQYNGYDRYLKTGPYNFGYLKQQAERVEHFAFQPGVLMWYVDNEYANNNVSEHPGHGQVLPIDSHAQAMKWKDGTLVSNKLQPWDAVFGSSSMPSLTLHRNGDATTFPKSKGVSTFDDTEATNYYDASNPTGSTLTAGSGVKVTVSGVSKDKAHLDVIFRR